MRTGTAVQLHSLSTPRFPTFHSDQKPFPPQSSIQQWKQSSKYSQRARPKAAQPWSHMSQLGFPQFARHLKLCCQCKLVAQVNPTMSSFIPTHANMIIHRYHRARHPLHRSSHRWPDYSEVTCPSACQWCSNSYYDANGSRCSGAGSHCPGAPDGLLQPRPGLRRGEVLERLSSSWSERFHYRGPTSRRSRSVQKSVQGRRVSQRTRQRCENCTLIFCVDYHTFLWSHHRQPTVAWRCFAVSLTPSSMLPPRWE